MSMHAAIVEATIRRLDNALNGAGFQTTTDGSAAADWSWEGVVATDTKTRVELRAGFPFTAPKVTLPGRDTSTSWHVHPVTGLCLWNSHDQGDLPWLDGAALVDRITEWVNNDEGGWRGDVPDLDLERYYPTWIPRGGAVPLLVLDDWARWSGRWAALQLKAHGRIETVDRPRTEYKNLRIRRGRGAHDYVGRAVDLGEMPTPQVTPDGLLHRMTPRDRLAAKKVLEDRPLFVPCRYTRGGEPALVCFVVTAPRRFAPYELRTIPIAESRTDVLTLRAGTDRTALSTKRVAIIGLGAIGSFMADQLARSGVNHLHLVDYDTLRPGNLVRHLAGTSLVGATKTTAVENTITSNRTTSPTFTHDDSVLDVEDAAKLLEEYDLVINATGDRSTQRRLQYAADHLETTTFLAVYVEGHGQYARADVYPTLHGAPPLPTDGVDPVTVTLREGGCGDPVSTTPPSVCIEAASIGTRHAIGLLTGKPIHPAGERRPMGPA